MNIIMGRFKKLLLLLPLLLLANFYCGDNNKQLLDSNIPTDTTIKTDTTSIGNVFGKYNRLCEENAIQDDCLKQICVLRAEYNLQVISCKIGRLGYDEEYCASMEEMFTEVIDAIEILCSKHGSMDNETKRN